MSSLRYARGRQPLKPGGWDWDLRDACEEAGVAFFFKQWGGPRSKSGGRSLDGREHSEKPMRPFHDGRHSSITNAAAAGVAPAALMARAGHSDFKTTQGYIDLAGETFRAEAELLE
jgi:integrase